MPQLHRFQSPADGGAGRAGNLLVAAGAGLVVALGVVFLVLEVVGDPGEPAWAGVLGHGRPSPTGGGTVPAGQRQADPAAVIRLTGHGAHVPDTWLQRALLTMVSVTGRQAGRA